MKQILIVIILLTFGCSNPSEPNLDTFIETSSTPIITGIYQTTIDSPDGTGDILGSPSYTVNKINIFPNPLFSYSPSGLSNFYDKVTFIHLPEKAKIVIVKGTISNNVKNGIINNGSINTIKLPIVVRTMVKNTNSMFAEWDLRDDNGNLVPSGFYRIYLEFDAATKYYDKIIWLDFYLIQNFDFKTWIDPTGWLPKNYNKIIFDPI